MIEKMSCPSFEKDKRLVKDDGEEEEAEVLEIEADSLPKSMSALLQLHLNIGTVRFDEHSTNDDEGNSQHEHDRVNTI